MRPEYATSRIHRKLRIHRILHVLQLSCHGVVALREVLVVQVIDGFVVGVQVLATGLVLVGVVVRAHLASQDRRGTSSRALRRSLK